jgi:GNAT superfamily N-acetyltransferase
LLYGKQANWLWRIREYDLKRIEIKRMFVHPEYRNKGIGLDILNELELWASELNYSE